MAKFVPYLLIAAAILAAIFLLIPIFFGVRL